MAYGYADNEQKASDGQQGGKVTEVNAGSSGNGSYWDTHPMQYASGDGMTQTVMTDAGPVTTSSYVDSSGTSGSGSGDAGGDDSGVLIMGTHGSDQPDQAVEEASLHNRIVDLGDQKTTLVDALQDIGDLQSINPNKPSLGALHDSAQQKLADVNAQMADAEDAQFKSQLDKSVQASFDQTAADVMQNTQTATQSLIDNMPQVQVADDTPDLNLHLQLSQQLSSPTRNAHTRSRGRNYDPHANDVYQPALANAARRNGFDSAQVAALVNAEAGRTRTGMWDPNARAPRGTAYGLTQYLKDSWINAARRRGTTLNDMAQRNGWLTKSGRVKDSAREQLLALRADPNIAITTAAEDLRHNIDELSRYIPPNATPDERIQYGYIAHHEGLEGARAFLGGTLSNDRASHLLGQQIGRGPADALIHNSPSAREAYENWLWQYTRNHVTPQSFRR